MKNIRFKADKVSGLMGDLYFISPVLEAIKAHNVRLRFNFHSLYGLTLDLEKNKVDEWIDETGYTKESNSILEEVKLHGTGYFEGVLKIVSQEADELRRHALRIMPQLSHLSEDDLLETYHRFLAAYIWVFGAGAITFIYESILSERLVRSVAERYAKAAEIVQAAMTHSYRSFMTDSDRALIAIRQATDTQQRHKLVQEYLEQYFFMEANYFGSPRATEDTVLVKAQKMEPHAAEGRAFDIHEDVSLTDEEQALVDLLKVTEMIHDQRKKANLIGEYITQMFLDEAVRRTGFDAKLARRIFWFEYQDLFFNAQALAERLAQRHAATLVLSGANISYHEDIRIEERVASKDGKEETELRGTPASQGKKQGIARIVFGPADFDGFQSGEILIAEMTRPDFLPVMKKAAAIVTDEGGLTCHAAIVSRELGIPCLVGVKRGTKVFQNGDLVEVDAEQGVVKVVKRA